MRTQPLSIVTLGNVAEYHVENFGCRASRSDGEAIASSLRRQGLTAAADPDSAHVVIVNTCSVTAEADRQARAWIRRIRRHNPGARVIVTGCYAQRAPEELAALPGVDAVVGNSHKALVAETAARFAAIILSPSSYQGFVPVTSILHDDFAHTELATLPFAEDALQTRPNLKVQDGCGNRCSFCIIPTTRGRSRSVPLKGCLESVERFIGYGGKELVLSGINLGHWGRDLNPCTRFEELVHAILTRTRLSRLRLSSIEPMDWSADLLALYSQFSTGEHPRLARHVHLPLQSGSDAILRRMHRRYRPWHYAERLSRIRAILPDAAIGADVMIGFPGETDSFFEETYQFIAAQPFTYLHLFPFSARPQTRGWELHQQEPVPAISVRERMTALRKMMANKSRSFRERFIGKTLSAITIESATEAVTDNFLKLSLDSVLPANSLVSACVTSLTEGGVFGRAVC